jgi:hypothetical protein
MAFRSDNARALGRLYNVHRITYSPVYWLALKFHNSDWRDSEAALTGSSMIQKVLEE